MGFNSVQEDRLKDSKNPVKALSRDDLLEAVAHVLDMAIERIEGRYTRNEERIKWARVAIQAVTAATEVLRDKALDELDRRVFTLEEGK